MTVAAASLHAQSTEKKKTEVRMPNPPAGFSWKVLNEVQAAFLMPAGWYFASQQKDGAQTYLITAEDVMATGSFSQGLVVNVFRNVEEKVGVAADEYAMKQSEAIRKLPGVEILDEWENVQGPFRTVGVRYKGNKPNGDISIVNQVNVGNSETGTLYLMAFEAPEGSWQDAWKIGQQMMSNFVIDQNF